MTIYTSDLPTGLVIEQDGVVFIGENNNEGSNLSESFDNGTEE